MATKVEKIKKQEHHQIEQNNWQEFLYTIILKSYTPAGRCFDIGLIAIIVLSVTTVMLNSIENFRQQYGFVLDTAEWVFTILFTLEYNDNYGVRLWNNRCSDRDCDRRNYKRYGAPKGFKKYMRKLRISVA